jgi:hypothetical protein
VQDQTLSWDRANSTYNGPDQGKNIINGGVNNIYVRAKNLNTVTGTGSVQLYYAKASLLLNPHDPKNSWQGIQSSTGRSLLSFVNGSNTTLIAAGEVAISNPSFLLTELSPVSQDHYCLTAVVQTPMHPVSKAARGWPARRSAMAHSR